MNCDVQSLLDAAKCFKCVPTGMLGEVQIYLLCQWLKKKGSCTVPPNKAINPTPASGSLTVNPINPVLSWADGGGATSYDVWFDFGAGLVFQGNQPGTTFPLGILAPLSIFSWRVDSVNACGTTTGDTWTFDTVDAFYYTPASDSMTWQDSGGSHTGNLAAFYATLTWATTTSVGFLPGNITSIVGLITLPLLATVACGDNLLISLDASGCAALTTLTVNNNSITSINVFGTALTAFDCSQNLLTALNLTGITTLQNLQCDNNPGLTGTLDLTACTGIHFLTCDHCSLTGLDVSGCSTLSFIQCNFNSLVTADFSGCSAIPVLSVQSMSLTTLNVTGCTSITSLDCSNNLLASLDTSTCSALLSIDCSGNPITALNVTANSLLTSLNVNNCTALLTLNCFNLPLSTLNISGCSAMTDLDCSGCGSLATLDVSTCVALKNLFCSSCNLTSLDVTNCTPLFFLDCSAQTFGFGSLSGLANKLALDEVDCYSNAIGSLDFTGCVSLRYVDASSNGLPALDVSVSAAMDTVNCGLQTSFGSPCLTSLKIGSSVNYIYVAAYTNALPAGGPGDNGVDDCIDNLYNNCLTNAGFMNLSSQTPAAPPSAPEAAEWVTMQLPANGWTGFTD